MVSAALYGDIILLASLVTRTQSIVWKLTLYFTKPRPRTAVT